MLRVLQVHNAYRKKGGEDKIVEFEYDLLSRQNDVAIDQLLFDNDHISISKLFRNQDSALQLEQKISDFKPDVVHFHNLFYNATPGLIDVVKDHNIPVIITLHNYRLICSNALLMRNGEVCEKCVHSKFPVSGVVHKCFQDSASKSLLLTAVTGFHKQVHTWEKVDKFIVLTDFAMERYLNSSLQVSEDQMIVKPNSIKDHGMGSIEDRKDFYLYVGRLSHEKGIETIQKAYSSGKIETPLEVIGDGPMMASWKKENNPLVHFHGFQDTSFIMDKMKSCKALVVPSICYEGLPTNILEAFCTGTPVICSDINNLNTIVQNGVTGKTFKTGNPEALIHELNHYSFNQEMSENARNRFLDNYTEEVNLKNLLAIYNSVIG